VEGRVAGAAVMLRAGRPGAALSGFRLAVRLDPDFLPAWLGMAEAFGALGRTSRAVAAYQRALRLSPGGVDVCAAFGWFLLEAGREQDAGEIFGWGSRGAHIAGPDSEDLQAGLAWLQGEAWCPSGTPTVRGLRVQVAQSIRGEGTAAPSLIEIMAQMLASPELGHVDRETLAFSAGRLQLSLGDMDAARTAFELAHGQREAIATQGGLEADVERRIKLERPRRGRATHRGPAPLILVGPPGADLAGLERMLSRHDHVRAGGVRDDIISAANRLAARTGMLLPEAMDSVLPLELRQEAERIHNLRTRESRGIRWLTERTPFGVTQLGLAARLFPEARIIHLDVDTAAGHAGAYTRAPLVGEPWVGQPDLIPVASRAHHRLMAHWRRHLSIIEIKTADLQRDPKASLEDLWKAIGLGRSRRAA
jgi:hypothetical protein